MKSFKSYEYSMISNLKKFEILEIFVNLGNPIAINSYML